MGRGYWNDGKVATNFGWGTYYDNVQLDWKRASGGSDYTTAYVYNMIDIFYETTAQSAFSATSPPVSFKINATVGSYYAVYAGPQYFLMAGLSRTHGWDDDQR